MTYKMVSLNPGKVLHDAILGAFRASGKNFTQWARDNDLSPVVARQITHGQYASDKSQEILEKMIDAAERELVVSAYRYRILREAEAFHKSAEDVAA